MIPPYKITVSEWAKAHRVSVWQARKALELKVRFGHAVKELVQRESPIRSRNLKGLTFYVYAVTK